MRTLGLGVPVRYGVLIACFVTGWTLLPGVWAACPLGACIKEDTCLQSAVSAGSPGSPLLVSICGNIVLGTSIKIDRPVTIDSSCPGGPCIVSLGNGLFGKDLPLFMANANLTLRNLVLQGGKATSGGAIQMDSSTASVTCTNVTFQSNTAQVSGGAIGSLATSTKGTASLTNCFFLSNFATTTDGTGLYGGAVYWPGPLRVQGCNFTANSADQGGGAVYFNGSSPSATADIRGSVFVQNSVTGREQGFGGAIFATGLAPLILSGNTFAYNQLAKGSAASLSLNGGAIYAEVPVLGAGNIIQNNSASMFGLGGGLQLSGAGNVVCGPSNISGNSASRGSDVYMSNRVTASVCPALPAETAVLGSTVSTCSQCTCASDFCDVPLATCQALNGSGFTCTCQPGYFGNGYYCDTVAPIVAGVQAPVSIPAPPPAVATPPRPSDPPSPPPPAPDPVDPPQPVNWGKILGLALGLPTGLITSAVTVAVSVVKVRKHRRAKRAIVASAISLCSTGARHTSSDGRTSEETDALRCPTGMARGSAAFVAALTTILNLVLRRLEAWPKCMGLRGDPQEAVWSHNFRNFEHYVLFRALADADSRFGMVNSNSSLLGTWTANPGPSPADRKAIIDGIYTYLRGKLHDTWTGHVTNLP